MCCVIVIKRNHCERSENALGCKLSENFNQRFHSTQIHHLHQRLQSKLKFEYGINSIEVAFLCDNVRYGSRWIRIVVGLDCVLKVLVSLKGFKIVLVLKDQQQETKDSAGRSSAVWHGSNRWNQRAKFRCVSRFCCIVYFLSRYRFIRFNCKLCTCC